MKKYLIFLLALILCLPSCAVFDFAAETTAFEFQEGQGAILFIRSGTQTVIPESFMHHQSRYGEEGFNASGAGFTGDPDTIEKLPKLELRGSVTAEIPNGMLVDGIRIFDSSDMIENFAGLSSLPEGEHIVVISTITDTRRGDESITEYTVTAEEHAFILIVPNPEETYAPGTHTTLEMMRYAPSGWGMEYKLIEYGNELIFSLGILKETGEISPEISDKEFDAYDIPETVKRGTFWLRYGDKLYRADSEFNTICLVQTHYGEGKLLAISEELSQKLFGAWYHAPYDSYYGTYKKGGSIPQLSRLNFAYSDISIKIKDINIMTAANTSERGNTITLEIISARDGEFKIELDCYASDDNLALGESKSVTLKAGEAQTLTLGFGGFPYDYWIMIKGDNTKIEIGIEH